MALATFIRKHTFYMNKSSKTLLHIEQVCVYDHYKIDCNSFRCICSSLFLIWFTLADEKFSYQGDQKCAQKTSTQRSDVLRKKTGFPTAKYVGCWLSFGDVMVTVAKTQCRRCLFTISLILMRLHQRSKWHTFRALRFIYVVVKLKCVYTNSIPNCCQFMYLTLLLMPMLKYICFFCFISPWTPDSRISVNVPLSFQCERVKVPEIYVTYERYAVKTTPRSSATIVSNKLIFSPVVYMHIKSNDLVRRFIADSGCSPCFVVTAKVKITHAHTYYLDTQIHIHSLGFHPLSQFQFDFLS